jgi:hypothetical protein
MLANRLPQRDVTLAMSIMCLPLVKGRTDRCLNRGRDVEIGLTYLQMYDINALAFHFSCPFQNFHDYKRGDLLSSSGDQVLHSPSFIPRMLPGELSHYLPQLLLDHLGTRTPILEE